VGSALTVDTNGVPLASLMYSLRNIGGSDLSGVRLPSSPGQQNGISYVFPKPEATTLYQAIAHDSVEQWLAANPAWRNPI
jgi:hypothetical protein